MMQTVFEQIRDALATAPHSGYVAALHLQVLKHAEALQNVSGREFCAQLEIGAAYGTEFSRMKKIYPKLKQAGLDPDRI